MNTQATLSTELTETDLAQVQGGNDQQDLIEFLERYFRDQERQRMYDGPIGW